MRVDSYSKEGAVRHGFNPPDTPVYAPNSLGGPSADPGRASESGGWRSDGDLIRAAASLHSEDDDFGLAGTLVCEVMDDAERDRLVANVVGHVAKVTLPGLRARIVDYWTAIDPTVGARIAADLEPEAPGAGPSAEESAIPA